MDPPGPRPRRRRPPWVRDDRARSRGLGWQLDHCFPLRLLLALVSAGLLLGVVNRWENCRHHGFGRGCLQQDPGGIISVDNVESLSIVTAAILYLLERSQRRQRENLEAMELILACQQAGARLSHARNEALETLSERGIWLDGLDLGGAQLDELHAPHGRWRGVNLREASLQRTCLHDSDLQGADLAAADLRQASLEHADLRAAILRNSDLRGADLRAADLREADLRGADLRGADTQGALLQDALLEPADRLGRTGVDGEPANGEPLNG